MSVQPSFRIGVGRVAASKVLGRLDRFALCKRPRCETGVTSHLGGYTSSANDGEDGVCFGGYGESDRSELAFELVLVRFGWPDSIAKDLANIVPC